MAVDWYVMMDSIIWTSIWAHPVSVCEAIAAAMCMKIIQAPLDSFRGRTAGARPQNDAARHSTLWEWKVEAQLNKALKNLCTRMYCDAKGNVWMVSFNLLTRISFNEKGEVNRVLSISYPYKAPDLGLCDVYRNGTVVMCNNGVVSEFSVQNNRLAAKNISSMFLPLDYRYAGAVISYHGKSGWEPTVACIIVPSRSFMLQAQFIHSSMRW